MNEYAAVLLWAIPGFLILVIFELFMVISQKQSYVSWILSLVLFGNDKYSKGCTDLH